jgi:hypothetical protein
MVFSSPVKENVINSSNVTPKQSPASGCYVFDSPIKSAVARALELPPYKPSPETKKRKHNLERTPSDLRVKDVREQTFSPKKGTLKTEYGKDPLSERAIEEKLEKLITGGRNVGIFVFQRANGDWGYTLGCTKGLPGGPHGELLAGDDLPHDAKVRYVYTEREPCKHCVRKLKKILAKEVRIIHSASHGTREHELAFREEQKAHDIRCPPLKKPRESNK